MSGRLPPNARSPKAVWITTLARRNARRLRHSGTHAVKGFPGRRGLAFRVATASRGRGDADEVARGGRSKNGESRLDVAPALLD